MISSSSTRPAVLTGHEREASHGGKRVVTGRVEQVEAVRLAADVVDFAVEVFDRRRVLVVEPVVEEARYERRLADLRRAEQH